MSKTKIRIATVDFKAAIDLISNAIAVYYSCVTLYNGILQQMSDVQRRALGAGSKFEKMKLQIRVVISSHLEVS